MKQIVRDTLHILTKEERKTFRSLIFFNAMVAIADIVSLALLVYIVSLYTQKNYSTAYASSIQWLYDKESILPVLFFLILFAIKSLVGYLVFTAQYRFVYRVSSRISETKLLSYLEGSYEDHVHTDSAVHVRNIMQVPIEFGHYVLSGIQQVFTESILAGLTIIALLLFNAQTFLILTLVLLPPTLLIALYTKRRLKNVRQHVKSTNETALQYLKEALGGYIYSNLYDKNNFFVQRYATYQQKMSQYLSDVHTTSGITSRFMELFAVIGLFVLVVINKYAGHQEALVVVNIGAFIAAAYKMIPSIVKISNTTGQIKTYSYSISALAANNGKKTTKETTESISSIEFEHVGYTYKDHQVLQDFNIDIKKGDFVGVYGPSGRGKTTFINLLLGFIDPNKGSITINSTHTNENERRSYWPRLAYVQQHPYLIHNSIQTNITLSDDDYDEQKLDEVIQHVGLDKYVAQYAEGIKKLITENGKNLSGGQRQRIAIARALYKEADLIILDEPFSELDTASEQYILEHLHNLNHAGKTIIMITHKMDNLSHCNKTYQIG